eukprot:2549327-Amphidinium_carterae.1
MNGRSVLACLVLALQVSRAKATQESFINCTVSYCLQPESRMSSMCFAVLMNVFTWFTIDYYIYEGSCKVMREWSAEHKALKEIRIQIR